MPFVLLYYPLAMLIDGRSLHQQFSIRPCRITLNVFFLLFLLQYVMSYHVLPVVPWILIPQSSFPCVLPCAAMVLFFLSLSSLSLTISATTTITIVTSINHWLWLRVINKMMRHVEGGEVIGACIFWVCCHVPTHSSGSLSSSSSLGMGSCWERPLGPCQSVEHVICITEKCTYFILGMSQDTLQSELQEANVKLKRSTQWQMRNWVPQF